MARQLNPERFYTHEMIEALATRANQEKANGQAQAGDSLDGSTGVEPSLP
jgi:hypothetical protein